MNSFDASGPAADPTPSGLPDSFPPMASTSAPRPTESEALDEAPPFFPPIPETLEDTGLTGAQITDLLLKTLYEQGAMEGDALAKAVALPFTLIDDLVLLAQQRHFVEVLEAHGHGRGGYIFNLTTEGRTLARAALETNRYVGPAPVPLEQFSHTLEMESVRDVHVRRQVLEGA